MVVLKVKRVPLSETLYIDVPLNMFDEMGWNSETRLMWFMDDEGNVCIRPPKHDTEPGIPVEFIDFLEDNDKNDSSSQT